MNDLSLTKHLSESESDSHKEQLPMRFEGCTHGVLACLMVPSMSLCQALRKGDGGNRDPGRPAFKLLHTAGFQEACIIDSVIPENHDPAKPVRISAGPEHISQLCFLAGLVHVRLRAAELQWKPSTEHAPWTPV